VLRELLLAAGHRGPYVGSSEELTPVARDPLAVVPVLAAGIACMVRPAWERAFTAGAVDGYALTPRGWQQLLAAAG
jgi:hypothetical protein